MAGLSNIFLNHLISLLILGIVLNFCFWYIGRNLEGMDLMDFPTRSLFFKKGMGFLFSSVASDVQ